MNERSQWGRILDYCAEHGSITIREAFGLDINSPSKRISEMRHSPDYVVDDIMEKVYDDEGKMRTKFKRYFIKEVS